MGNELIEPHEATGDLELIAVRFAEGRDDSIGVVALRWKDSAARIGESSRSRLVLYIDRGGSVVVDHNGTLITVETAPASDGGGDVLCAVVDETDLVLALPRY